MLMKIPYETNKLKIKYKQMNNFFTFSLKWGVIVLVIALIASCNQSSNNTHSKRKAISEEVKANKTKQTIENQDFLKSIEPLQHKYKDNGEVFFYKLNTKKSLISWFCVTHIGYIKFNEGSIGVIDGEIISAQLEICMDSIADTDIDYLLMREVLTNTLKSADFFNVKEYPIATFSLSHLKKADGSFYHTAGDLKIREMSKSLYFKSSITQNDSLILIISERFSMDRTLWDITIYSENYEQTDDSFLFTDMVDLQVSLWLER